MPSDSSILASPWGTQPICVFLAQSHTHTGLQWNPYTLPVAVTPTRDTFKDMTYINMYFNKLQFMFVCIRNTFHYNTPFSGFLSPTIRVLYVVLWSFSTASAVKVHVHICSVSCHFIQTDMDCRSNIRAWSAWAQSSEGALQCEASMWSGQEKPAAKSFKALSHAAVLKKRAMTSDFEIGLFCCMHMWDVEECSKLNLYILQLWGLLVTCLCNVPHNGDYRNL